MISSYPTWILLLLLLLQQPLNAQIKFSRWDSIPVTVFPKGQLPNAWAGGFNNPQFSKIDLNGDGVKDLFVFDRSGDMVLTFLNSGTPNVASYHYAPSYRSYFPRLTDWALLNDYSCDGKMDIFTSSDGGIAVYKNQSSSAMGLSFSLAIPKLRANSSLGVEDIFVSPYDIPAIVDIDGDGDLDILTFEVSGSTMQFFRNMAEENYGRCDTFDLTLADNCYGQFLEAFGSCSMSLGISCRVAHATEEKHAGSTTLALDLNGDKAMEFIIGDITCTTVKTLINGGDSVSADMIAIDSLYPSSHPINIFRFPAAFHLDVNNDGVLDLLAAPNGLNVSANLHSAWYYENTGTNESPNFSFVTDAFLQEEMIDLGEGSYPCFFDVNGDGLLDMLVGNYGYFSTTSSYTSGLAFFKNVGTSVKPEFELMTRDYEGLSALGIQGIYPTFGDLDDDGDKDMIIGESTGVLHYFENNSQADSAHFVLIQPNLGSIDVGQFSTPQLVDVNNDGKLDLIIGERAGNLNYYENISSGSVPEFVLVSDTFGGVDVRLGNPITGYSNPFLAVIDTTGEYSLVVGSESGHIFRYTNIENNLNGKFTLADTAFQNIDEGGRAVVSGGDINDDGKIDLVVGNYRGGLAIYKNGGDSIPLPPRPSEPLKLLFYPVPASGELNIEILSAIENEAVEITLYDVIGQKAFFNTYPNSSRIITVDVRPWANGVYVAKVRIGKEQIIHKVILIN